MSNLGDINRDGKIDFAIGSYPVGTYIFLGGRMDTIPQSILIAGLAERAGDVIGDGFGDVLVSDFTFDDYRGKVWLYYGGNPMDTIPDWSAQGDSVRYWFGYSLSGGYDLNGDGYSDFLIAGFRSVQEGEPAYIRIYYGAPSPDTLPRFVYDARTIPGINENFPSIINDINGDGKAEVAINHGGPDTSVYVYFGRDSLRRVPDIRLRGSAFSARGSFRIASVGDVNGDGLKDVVVGNKDSWGRLGEVLLYLGHPRISGRFDIEWTGFTGPWYGTGQAVAWCGDVNHVGRNDIIFSSYDEGFETRSGRVDIFGGDTSLVVSVLEQESVPTVPEEFTLEQNYPNPFNGSTRILYTVRVRTMLSLTLYDVAGRQIRKLIHNAYHESGQYSVPWDGTDDGGTHVASGVYFYRLQSSLQTATKKVVLLQ